MRSPLALALLSIALIAAAGDSRATSRTLFSSTCDPLLQLRALLQLYASTGGSGWTNSGGWPSNVSGYMAATATAFSGSCMTTSQPVTATADHCCWYGVMCCLPNQACTPNLVTKLSLGNNKVGGGMGGIARLSS